MKHRRKGVVLILAGIGIILLTFLLGDNYWSRGGLIQNMRQMKIVVQKSSGPVDPFKPDPQEIDIPCNYVFSGGIVMILVGAGMVILKDEKVRGPSEETDD